VSTNKIINIQGLIPIFIIYQKQLFMIGGRKT